MNALTHDAALILTTPIPLDQPVYPAKLAPGSRRGALSNT